MDEPSAGAREGSETLPERRFGWNTMFVPPDEDPRNMESVFGELPTLRSYLTGYRQTLEMKCAGLDAEQLARRSVPPSDMSLLGLVRHAADVEVHWFRRVLGGEEVENHYPQTAFSGAEADPALVDEAFSLWHEEIANSDHFVESAPNLDVEGVMHDGSRIALREVLVHLIEEYARHCGHADLIRERIDGRVGQ